MGRHAVAVRSSSRARAGSWWAALLMLPSAGCLIDEQRCGDHQIEEVKSSGMGACVCAPDSVPNPRGYDCMPCGSNERPNGSLCGCVEGFRRDSVSGTCVAGDVPVSDGGVPTELPTGQGAPCTSSSDCAGFAATFCPPVAPKACLVEGCAAADVRCSDGLVCCQIPLLTTMARLGSICIPSAALMAGACPYEGTLVPE